MFPWRASFQDRQVNNKGDGSEIIIVIIVVVMVIVRIAISIVVMIPFAHKAGTPQMHAR